MPRHPAAPRRAARLVVPGIVALATVLASCGGDAGVTIGGTATATDGTPTTRPGGSAPQTTPAPGATTVPATSSLAWEDCGRLECATLTVPIDHDDPAGGTIDLFLKRRPAGDDDERVGTLLVNPGGPGIGATLLVDQAQFAFGDDLLDRFDIVSWDPRGTGRSAPVDCIDDLDPLLTVDPSADSEEERQATLAEFRRFAEACAARNPDTLGHIGTVDTGKDMDLVRAALGDEQVSYFGFSYGSELGATYATLFPERVRAMVLDGAANANASYAESSVEQAVSIEAAFDRIMQSCAQDEGCAFHNDGDPWTAFDALWQQVDTDPLEVEPDRPPVGQAVLWWAVIQSLYDESYWPELTDALADAARGDGAGLLRLYDSYAERDDRSGTWSDSFEGLIAINCLDDPGPSDPAEIAALAEELRRVAPRIGGVGDGINQCAFWPVRTGDPLPLTGRGAGPIVVIGSTGDPITPLTSSRALVGDLEGGVLLTVDAEGHTGYGRNRCVVDAVDRYLIDGTVPAAGTVCR